MWIIQNEALPANPLTSAAGLELLTLGNDLLDAPLFRANNTIKFTTPVGEIPNLEVVTEVEDPVFLYRGNLVIFTEELEFQELSKVSTVNSLFLNSSTTWNGVTVALTDEELLTTPVTQEVPLTQVGTSLIYTANLPLGLEIARAKTEGLVLPYDYNSETGVITLYGNPSCFPRPNSNLTVTYDVEYTVENENVVPCQVLDYAALDVSYISLFTYLGKTYLIDSSLAAGTLFNDFTNKHVFLIG